MTCAEAREALLTADLADLEATAGPLHDHLVACVTCRRDIARVLAAHRALRAPVGPRGLEAAEAAARRAVGEGRVRIRSRRRRRLASALGAAAVIAALLFVPSDRGSAPPIGITTTAPAPPPLVETASGRVAVITTRRPDITVVWQF